MKTLALTTALALAVSAPAIAQTQLERSVGAAPGQYTTAQLFQLRVAQENSGNEARVYFQDTQVDVSSNRHSPTALRIFQSLASEESGNESRRPWRAGGLPPRRAFSCAQTENNPAQPGCLRSIRFTKGQSGTILNPSARASATSRSTSARPAPVPRIAAGTPV